MGATEHVGDTVMDIVIEKFVEGLQAGLRNRTVVRKKMSRIRHECGRGRISGQFLSEVQAALDRAEIYTDKPLDSRATLPDDIIRFSRKAFVVPEIAFGLERQLIDVARRAIGSTPPLDLLEIHRGPEFTLPSGRRVDLLCRERDRGGRGALVAVEFKRGRARAGALQQLREYLDELVTDPISRGRQVKGILLAQKVQIDPKWVATCGHPVAMYEYSLAFNPVVV